MLFGHFLKSSDEIEIENHDPICPGLEYMGRNKIYTPL
jgi:hypothetical protein